MKKVLLVEDEEKLAKALMFVLEEEGYETIHVEDGRLGLEMARSEKPDIILLDIMLPTMDGFEICKTLKSDEKYKSIPIIMMTGLADTENTVKGLSAGADDYVSKPFNMPELLARVKSHLRMKDLYDIVKREEEEKTALLNVSQSLSSTISPHETLYIIVSKIAEVIEVKRCSIIYVNNEKNEAYVMASHDSKEIHHLKIDIEKYPEIQKIIETGEPVIINDVYNDPILFSVREVLSLIDIKSIMAFPVSFKDSLIGTLILRTTRRESSFTEREIRFCEVISHLAGAPLKNAYLFDVLYKEKEEERSKRISAEETLWESQGQLQAITDNTTAIICLKDTEGRYLRINHQYEKLFNITKEEVIGRTDYDIFPKEIADAFRANDKKVLEANGPLSLEEIAPHKDGPHTYISIKFPLHDSSGEPYAVCGISTDITDRKKAEEEINEAYKELKEKTDRLQKFHKLTVGRELDMVRLKEEVNILRERLGEPKKYDEPDQIKLETRNPQPATRNPQRATRNPQRATRNPQPATRFKIKPTQFDLPPREAGQP